jgi:hypothetical protein
MLAEGFAQQPVLAGPQVRRQAPLFGGLPGRLPARAAVLGVDGDGAIILQGGRASGIRPGCELALVDRKREGAGVRVRVVSAELTRSRAMVIGTRAHRDTESLVQVADLFELERWVVPDEPILHVWIPETDLSSAQLYELGSRLQQLTASIPHVRWVSEPLADLPTHVLSWRSNSWQLHHDDTVQALGRQLGFESLRHILESSSAEVRLFVHLPVPSALRNRIGLGRESNDAIEVTTSPSQAVYLLVGRLHRGHLEYSWIRPDVVAGDEAISPLPMQTRWLPFEEGERACQHLGLELEELAGRLGNIRAWLTLDSPKHSFFPYRLALYRQPGNELRLGDQSLVGAAAETSYGALDAELRHHYRLTAGEQYGLVLRAEPADVADKSVPRRYLYVFLIDSSGRSTLFFPHGSYGSVENFLPELMPAENGAPVEIPLGRQPSLEIDRPWGVDTYFLLTTDEQIPDPYVLHFDGVRSADVSTRHPLERLLRNRGARTRSGSIEVPTTWSIHRVSYEAAEEPEGISVPRFLLE